MHRALLAGAIASALAVSPALAQGDGRPAWADRNRGAFDWWPLVVRDPVPTAGVRVTRALGPLFESWRRDAGAEPLAGSPRIGDSGWTLRPLLASIDEPPARMLEFLYPLGARREDAGGLRERLTPFYDRALRPAGGETPADGAPSRWSALLALGGRTAGGEGYAAVFPFGGVVKERFGLERIEFALFPLYARTLDPKGFARHYVLWPFLSWGSGGGRELFRIWPFYGRDVREGDYDRRFALWPFVHWRRERIGTDAERTVRLALPLYGAVDTERSRARLFTPFFMRSENDRTGERAIDAPWPFVRVAGRPAGPHRAGYRELRVEPFFHHVRSQGYRRTRALLGAVDVTRSDRPDERLDSLRLLYALDLRRLLDPETGEVRTRQGIWPLFRRVARRASGELPEGELRAPYLLPLGGGGWERHAVGLTTLYERRWRGGELREDLLWGFARRRTKADFAQHAFAWLSLEEPAEEPLRVRFLGVRLW